MGSRSAFVVLLRAGELGSPGPRGREGRRRAERTSGGRHGRGHEPREPVNETTLDSRTDGGGANASPSELLSGDMTDSYGPAPQSQRSSPAKNRMREFRTSGSVRGEGGNILAYSAVARQAEALRLSCLRPKLPDAKSASH